MSVPIFPTLLPRPMRDGYSQTVGDNRRRTAPDAGPLVQRARFSSVADPVSLTFELTRDERAVFEKFYFEDIKRGALPFLMRDPGTDGWPLGDAATGQPLLMPDGRPIVLAATWLCLISDQVPQYSVVGVNWRVSFGISVMPA